MVTPSKTVFATTLRRHPKWILVFMVVLTVIGGYGASKSRVDNSLKVWQSEGDPNWLAYQQFQKRTSLTDPLLIFIPATNKLTIDQITISLIDIDEVGTCQNVEIETLQGNRSWLISLFPISGATPEQLSDILKRIPTILDRNDVKKYHLGGVWYLTNQLDTLSAKSTTIFFPMVLVVTGILVLILCPSQAILILSCGMLPALLLVGIIGLCEVKMNMVLLALPPLTLILGLAHAIHFSIKKYQTGDTPITIFCKVAPPCMLSGLTTALGFASLLFSSYQPVRELGIWGAIGAILSLTITFLLVPVFLRENSNPPRISLSGDIVCTLARNKKIIIALLFFILLLAVFGIGKLQKGSLILDFFSHDSDVRQHYKAIEKAGVGLTPMEVDLFQKPLSRELLDRHLKELASLHPEITHFLFTLTDQSKQVESIKAKILTPSYSLPSQRVERITILLQTIASEKTLAIADDLELFFQSRLGTTKTPYVTGSVPLYTRGQKELFSSMLRSFSAAFLAISLLIGVMLRSIKMAFIAMVPNLLPVVLVVAIMGWFEIPLSVATMTVASIIFGIVVDDTIHFLHSWQTQNKILSSVQKLRQVFSQVGAPIITTTLVTGTGFLAFLASPFIPLAHFGLLISLALWMALICDLCVLPILLMRGCHDRPHP